MEPAGKGRPMLTKIVGNVSRVRVLRALFHLGPASVAEIAAHSAVPARSVRRALEALLGVGLVLPQPARGAKRYRLNPAHVFHRPLHRLFEGEAFMANRLAQVLGEVGSAEPFRGLRVRHIGWDRAGRRLSVWVEPHPGDLAPLFCERARKAIGAACGLALDVVLVDARPAGHDVVWPLPIPGTTLRTASAYPQERRSRGTRRLKHGAGRPI